MRGIFNQNYCTGQVPNPPAVDYHIAFEYITSIRDWYNGGIEAQQRPNYVMTCPKHDWKDYLNCDYPSYYRKLGDPQLDLYNARGIIVKVKSPRNPVTKTALNYDDNKIKANRNRTIAGIHYFDHYPAVYLFEVNLTSLLAPAGTLAHLNNNVINDLSAVFTANGNALTVAAVGSTEKDDREWRIIDGNKVFHLRCIKGSTIIKIYRKGTAIEMVQTQYNLLKNNAVFRAALINDAHAAINAKYPGVKPAPIYDSF